MEELGHEPDRAERDGSGGTVASGTCEQPGGSPPHRLAEARGTSVTAAVREALRRELADLDAAKAERDRRARALFAKWAKEPPARPWTEADMYDEDGIPHIHMLRR